MRWMRWWVGVLTVGVVSGCPPPDLFEIDTRDGFLTVVTLDGDEGRASGIGVEVYAQDPGSPAESLVAAGVTGTSNGGIPPAPGEVFFRLEQGEYRVRVVDSPYEHVFLRTEYAARVGPGGGSVVLRAAEYARLDVTVRWASEGQSGQLGGVRIELLDDEGTVRQTATSDRSDIVTFSVPRRPHRLRISEYPEWVTFDEPAVEVDTGPGGTSWQELTFTGAPVDARRAEAVVTADGSPLEGVTVDFLEDATRAQLGTALTDAEGVARWADPPEGRAVAAISGYDQVAYAFDPTEQALDIGAAPGPYVVRFKGTATSVNQPPIAAIIQPSDGTIFTAGQPATFVGSGVDPEDGFLTGGDLVWTSSLDGSIGAGETIVVSTLLAGAHRIVLTATDRDGAVDADTIDVTISATGTATIQGAVTLAGGGLAGVRVSATGPSVATTVTDDFGNYTLGGLAAGTYDVAVSGYPAWVLFDPASVSVTVTDGETVTQGFAGSGG